jgi:hypothetical protein
LTGWCFWLADRRIARSEKTRPDVRAGLCRLEQIRRPALSLAHCNSNTALELNPVKATSVMKPKNRRTTEPSPLAVAALAAMERNAGGRQMQWMTVNDLARLLGVDAEVAVTAIGEAVERRWLIGVGDPLHSVCLASDFQSLGVMS